MTDPVIKVTNPYGIPQDIRDSARAQGEDNPLDIRGDDWKKILLKVLGLPGIAMGVRTPGNLGGLTPPTSSMELKQGVVKLPSSREDIMSIPGMRDSKQMAPVRPGQGTEVPGNLNTPQYQGPIHLLPDDLRFNQIINKIDTDAFRNYGKPASLGDRNFKVLQQGLDELPPTSKDMANMPGMRSAGEPLGSPAPVNKITEYLMGKNEGKGNFGPADAMGIKLPGNDMPTSQMKLTGPEKFELARQDQQLKAMGFTEKDIANMSPMERIQALFPRLFDD